MYEELLQTAVRASRGAGGKLLEFFGTADLDVRAKGDYDFVSRADHESEAYILGEIRRDFPDHRILAEESGNSGSAAAGGEESEFQWVIDPLDGTSNFLQGLPYWAISIGCRRGSEMVAAVILDPFDDRLFSATRGGGAFLDGQRLSISQRPGLDGAFLATGYPFKARRALDTYLDVFRDVFLRSRAIRRCGAAALDLAYTAAGVYDGFFEFRLAPWDLAAGSLLVQEAGGVVTDLDGGVDYLAGGNVIAGPGSLQAELLELVRRHVDEARLDQIDPRQEPVITAPAVG